MRNFYFRSVVDPRPNEWRRSYATYTLPDSRQQHCLAYVNKNILLFGGTWEINYFLDDDCFYLGCQKNGDDIQNSPTIVRAINQSSSNTGPDWYELEQHFQHPRTDCGYFQLGKYKIHIARAQNKGIIFNTTDFSSFHDKATLMRRLVFLFYY